MKAISLKQPWASLIATGKKTIETRTWQTNYRGKILIVSSKTMDRNFPVANLSEILFEIPFGKALATANLIDCRPMTVRDSWFAYSPYRSNLFAWVLKDIRALDKPFPVKGQLGIYEVEIPE